MEPVADEVPSQVRESFAHAHQAPEAAANPTAVHGKELFESELLASSSHSVAHQVPTTVRDSIAHSHRAPEAAADAGAVHKKAMVEGELLAHLEHSSPLGAGGIQSRREESSQAGLNSTANAAHSSGPAGMAELGFTSHNSVIGHGSHEDHDIALHQREGHSEDHRESQIDASSGKKERLHIAGAAAAVPIGAGVYNTVAGHGSQDDHHPTSVAPTARSIPADSNAVGAPGDLHPTNKSAVTFQDPTGTDSKTKNRLFPLVKKHPGSTAIVSDDNYFGPPSQAVSTGEAATPMPAELRPSRQREDTSIADESSGFETAGSAAVPGYSDDHAGDTSGPVTGANNTSSAPAKEPATVKTSGDSLNHLPSVTVSGVSHEANSTGRIFGFGMPRDQGSQITQTGLQEQHSQPAGTDRHTSGKQTAGQQALKNETLGQQSGPGRAAGNSAPGDGYNHLSSGTPSGVAS